MNGFVFHTSEPDEPERGVRTPLTAPESKEVMLVAQRGDHIQVGNSVNKFDDADVPESVEVLQRTTTYYGPKLVTKGLDGGHYLLTAPGPGSELIIWKEQTNDRGGRLSWYKLAEVSAVLSDRKNDHHICPQCNEPLKTAEHERLAALGRCQNV